MKVISVSSIVNRSYTSKSGEVKTNQFVVVVLEGNNGFIVTENVPLNVINEKFSKPNELVGHDIEFLYKKQNGRDSNNKSVSYYFIDYIKVVK